MTRRRKIGVALLIALGAAAIAGTIWYRRPRPLRFPEYTLDVTLPAPGAARVAPLRAGVGSADITPDLAHERVYMSGFHQNRLPTGVHDPLFARALVLDDGRTRIAIVACDLIGQHHDQVLLTRREMPEDFAIDYLALCSTHNHEGPDTVGLWGPHPLSSGVDAGYLARVRAAAIDAIRQAIVSLAPARLAAAEADVGKDDLVRDSRPPTVIDPRLLALRIENPGAAPDAPARATLLLWSNHPETLADDNLLISSDFPGYARRAVERDGGGTCLYVSGTVGGLMTPLEHDVRGLDGKIYSGNTFEKAEAIGEVLARRAREALLGPGAQRSETAPLAVRAHLLDVETENRLYWIAMKLNVLDRGLAGTKVRTEVGALRIGPVALALVPGELYPEIAVGGIESPENADFPGEPVEVPPLRTLLAKASPPGSLGGILGLANDEIGYIIPRTQWDAKSPYTYGQTSAPYGEVNSIGPSAGPTVYRALAGVIGELPR
jgi:hypothetical protein